MAKKHLNMINKKVIIATGIIITLTFVVIVVVIARNMEMMNQDITLNRLKANVQFNMLTNLQECVRKGDAQCPDGKYVSSKQERAELKKFLDNPDSYQ